MLTHWGFAIGFRFILAAAMSDDDSAGAISSSPLLFESSADDDDDRVVLWGEKEHSDASSGSAALLAPDTDTEDALVVPGSASDSDSASAASSAVLQAQVGAGVYPAGGRCQELAVEDRGLTQSFRGFFLLTSLLERELTHEQLQMSRLCSLSTFSTHCSGILCRSRLAIFELSWCFVQPTPDPGHRACSTQFFFHSAALHKVSDALS